MNSFQFNIFPVFFNLPLNNSTFLSQSSPVPPKTPTLTSSASGILQTGTTVTLTCKTTSPGTATYKFYKNNSDIHVSSSSGRSGSYVVPSTAGAQNSFTCKAIISGVSSAASSSVTLKFDCKWMFNYTFFMIYHVL